MRIDRLDLIAFGPFTDKSLSLSDGASGLHLIYGDNEAGKSTSLRALIAWLFGIPTRTNDNHLHSNTQLRIGGKLRLSSGKDIEFVRRKGAKGTLLEPGTDNPLDDSALLPFLPSGIDENLFTKLYGIDHDGLVAGGQELLDQSGDLGQALFSAAVGTAGLRDILSDLQ
ncbi:MAG: AAA family ATPase, partial [Deltaproteobacteria bacterium]|nr:AAA family ATPase [Deltaproteobacteria bacterium]